MSRNLPWVWAWPELLALVYVWAVYTHRAQVLADMAKLAAILLWVAAAALGILWLLVCTWLLVLEVAHGGGMTTENGSPTPVGAKLPLVSQRAYTSGSNSFGVYCFDNFIATLPFFT